MLLISALICALLAIILLIVVAYREHKYLKSQKEIYDRKIKILRRKVGC